MARCALRSAGCAVALVVALIAQRGTAAAQSCGAVPVFDDRLCANAGNSIDDYKKCYGDLYDKQIIPGFRYIASCSHPRADAAMTAVLEAAAAKVTGAIQAPITAIDAALAAPDGVASCIAQLATIDAALEDTVFKPEHDAPDLDAYRRASYGVEQLTGFTDIILQARQNRAACSDSLLAIRKRLVLLSDLKAHHLDYCQILRDSAHYEDASRIQSLAQFTSIDPDINFGQYFSLGVTWNLQCGYFDSSSAGTNLRYTPCLQSTVEYRQTLTDLNGSVVGWLSDNRNAIVALSMAAGSTIAGLAGAGTAAGPIGALVGAVVGAIISGLDYWMLTNALAELDELIAAKQAELRDVIQQSYISKPEFDARVEALCGGWQPIVQARVDHILSTFKPDDFIQAIDGYFALSDKLHDWYNQLFLWATDGASGQRFIDTVTEQELLVKRDAFDQQIFRARTDQEIAAQENILATFKGNTSLLNCNVSTRQRRGVLSQLRGGVDFFNGQCASVMAGIGVRSDGVVPFTKPDLTSDVTCAYTGFRNDVATLEIRAGAGSSADMTLRDATGASIAELTGVTSDSAPGFPGFACQSESGASFGVDDKTVLTPGTYPLALRDNTFGFGNPEAQAMRAFIKDLDSKLRLKAIVCNRQLGTTLDLPHSADACGIPVTF